MKKPTKPAKAFISFIEQKGYLLEEGSDYINSQTKIYITKRNCTHESFLIAPYYTRIKLNKDEEICPGCTTLTKNRKRVEKLKKSIKRNYGNEFMIVGEFKEETGSVNIFHASCGETYPRKIASLLGSKDTKLGCKKCLGKRLAKSQEQFKKEVNVFLDGEYEVVGNYVNASTPVKMKHANCGNINLISRDGLFFRGTRCSYCSNPKKKLTHEEFVELVNKLGNGEYSVIGEYRGSNRHVKFKHDKCGCEWETYASSFTREKGTRCPRCMIGKSHDAIKIENFLSKTNLLYLTEYTIEKCINIRPLPFDFGIIKNNKLLLIEYDGKQHFEEVSAWGGKEKLQETNFRDNVKNQYCIENNIPLIRIPYWESENIENILSNTLSYFDFTNQIDKVDRSLIESYLVKENWDQKNYYKSLNLIVT